MTVGERIRLFRERKGMSQTELAKLAGISKQNLYKYENNIITNIPSDKIEIIAAKLGITPAALMGWESNAARVNNDLFMIPLFNSVAAGFGVIADNTIIDYIPTPLSSPSEQDKYIWINVQGDSMSPLIDDGSEILVKRQESLDSGQIGVALIDDEEAVVKKIKYGDDWIELISVNPYYPPRRFEANEVLRVRIVGVVKKITKNL